MSQKRTRVDGDITSSKVRVIGKEGEQVGVMSIDDALAKASEESLNLVEISPQADPPVCKVMDFGKYLFDVKKRKNAQKKKQHVTQVKEMKFRPTTEDADYLVKLRKIMEFIDSGHRVKITMRFRGREITFRDLGAKLFDRLKTDTQEVATVERDLQLEGRQFFMLIVPNKS